jgi:hypothetical protein
LVLECLKMFDLFMFDLSWSLLTRASQLSLCTAWMALMLWLAAAMNVFAVRDSGVHCSSMTLSKYARSCRHPRVQPVAACRRGAQQQLACEWCPARTSCISCQPGRLPAAWHEMHPYCVRLIGNMMMMMMILCEMISSQLSPESRRDVGQHLIHVPCWFE